MHNLDTYQQIEKIKTLKWIRESAIFLKPSLESDNPKEIEEARDAHTDLVDRFYSETADHMPQSQYEAARRNFEYFLRLIDLALAYFTDRIDAEGQIQ